MPKQNFNGDIVGGAVLSAGTELITNGNMELDSGWIDVGTPITNEISSTQAHGGTYSRKVTVDDAYEGVETSNNFSLFANRYYEATAWIYGDGTNYAQLAVFDGTNRYFSPLSVDLTGHVWPASWTEQKWIFKCLLDQPYGRILLQSGSAETTGTWYLDDVSIRQIPMAVEGNIYLTGNARVVIPTYANNAAAIAGGLLPGQLYRVNAATDPEPLYICH